MVRSHLKPSHRVLNLGAGPPTQNPLRILRGEVAQVVGADIDPCVLENAEMDQAVLIVDGRIPLPDQAFDLIISDYVFEHVNAPRGFLSEAARVLKPGGGLMFRTPNILHYVAIISALTPHSLHSRLANRVRAKPDGAQDPWPTRYRMNSVRRLRRLGRQAGFDRLEVRFMEMEPSYLRFASGAFLLGAAYERLVNSTPMLAPFRANLFGRFVKRDQSAENPDTPFD